jgi:hypothetical protein
MRLPSVVSQILAGQLTQPSEPSSSSAFSRSCPHELSNYPLQLRKLTPQLLYVLRVLTPQLLYLLLLLSDGLLLLSIRLLLLSDGLLLLLHGTNEHGRQLAVLHAEVALGVHLADFRRRHMFFAICFLLAGQLTQPSEPSSSPAFSRSCLHELSNYPLQLRKLTPQLL